MEELIAMLNVIKKMIKDGDLHIINCSIDKKSVDILVSEFKDVPTEKGTEYELHDSANSNGLCYEKKHTLNGAMIHTYGTKRDMMSEFAEANNEAESV